MKLVFDCPCLWFILCGIPIHVKPNQRKPASEAIVAEIPASLMRGFPTDCGSLKEAYSALKIGRFTYMQDSVVIRSVNAVDGFTLPIVA